MCRPPAAGSCAGDGDGAGSNSTSSDGTPSRRRRVGAAPTPRIMTATASRVNGQQGKRTAGRAARGPAQREDVTKERPVRGPWLPTAMAMPGGRSRGRDPALPLGTLASSRPRRNRVEERGSTGNFSFWVDRSNGPRSTRPPARRIHIVLDTSRVPARCCGYLCHHLFPHHGHVIIFPFAMNPALWRYWGLFHWLAVVLRL
jgi:hypothetical protein